MQESENICIAQAEGVPVALPGGCYGELLAVAPSGVVLRNEWSCDGPGVLEIRVDGIAVSLALPVAGNFDLCRLDHLSVRQ